MANKFMESCPNSLVIREIPIKTRISGFLLIELVKRKTVDSTQCC